MILMRFTTRTRFFARCGIGVGLIALSCTIAGSAQPRAKLAANPQASGSKGTSTGETAISPAEPNESVPATKQPKVKARTLQKAERLSTQLMQQSGEAFHLGLMGLADYVDRLSVAVSLNSAIAENAKSDAVRIKALTQQAAALQDALDRLEKFNQPAAKGWAADVAYAQLLAARARVELNPPHSTATAQQSSLQIQQLALRQFEQRNADYHVGLAGLPEMSRAASYLGLPASDAAKANEGERGRQIALMTEYRDRLSRYASKTDALSQRGAELGRDDKLSIAQFELARTSGVLAGLEGNKSRAAAEFAKADRHAQQAFDAQSRYHQHGTASLADLTLTWQLQDGLHQQMPLVGAKPAEGDRHGANFTLLNRMADQLKDKRGRNAADISMVHSLGALRELTVPAKATASRERETTK